MLFAIRTRISITGTSVRRPTTVASTTGLSVPNSEIATATDNSKKLDAPIIAAGADILWGSLSRLLTPYARKNIKNVCMIRGIAISIILKGFSNIFFPCNEKIMINVSSNPIIVIF